MITLGVDVGTTHTKVLAREDETGAVLALEAAPTPVVRDDAGEARVPADVLESTLGLIERVAGRLERRAEVRALCVASVGEEVVLLLGNGDAVGEIIAWYDQRGSDEAERFLAGAGAELPPTRRWPPDATFSIFKLRWLLEHRPDELAASATWTDLGDYVLAALGGEVVMDWSHASRAGAFDLVSRAWDADTISALGLEVAFPRLVPSRTVVGTLSAAAASRTGLGEDVALVTGGHDHLCAAFGAGLRTGSELFLSAGTSEAHLALLDDPLEAGAAVGIDQGCYVDESRYYAHVNIRSGHFFRQWRELLYDGVDEAALYAEVEAVADLGGIDFAPLPDHRTARLDAVPYDADRAQVMRALLEGLARTSVDIVDRLERASGHRFDRVIAAGHPASIPLWRQLREEGYGRPLTVVDQDEPTAYGAAVMAATALGSDGTTIAPG